MHNQSWSLETEPINGPEDLREITRGSDIETVQLKPGKLQGSITHIGIGNLGISRGQFSSKTRLRGTLHRERVVLGTMLDSAGRSTQWWRETRPGDISVFPAHVELDAFHGGVTSYLAVSIPAPELASMLAAEEHLADPVFWNTKGVYQIDPLISVEMLQRLVGIISGIEQRFTAPSDHAADFLKRSVIESFLVGVMGSLPSPSARPHRGARLVSETEEYVDAAGGRPVHISEICSALKVSRRSLHRAFADTLEVGPVAYLRRKRLSAIRSVLSRSDPATFSIGDVAFEYGFPEPGRFAAYYRAHFGEKPSETCLSRMGKSASKASPL